MCSVELNPLLSFGSRGFGTYCCLAGLLRTALSAIASDISVYLLPLHTYGG